MARHPLIRTSDHFYHVYNKSNQGHWFSESLEQVWFIAMESLRSAYRKHPVQIAQFVLMSNHYHLLIRTPNLDLDLFMYEFNKNFSLKLRNLSGLENRMFGSRYKWCVVHDEMYLWTVYKYIYQNPLRQNLVHACEDYPYSTLKFGLHKQRFCIPLFKEYFNDKEMLSFLNEKVEKDVNNKIKKALKKPRYKIVTSRIIKK